MEKKNSSRPFLAHPAGGQETTFYLRVALWQPKTRIQRRHFSAFFHFHDFLHSSDFNLQIVLCH